MNRSIYAIYDNKAKDLLKDGIWIEHHNASAIRQFQETLNNEKSIINKYPQDFDLVKLGELTEIGQLLSHDFEYNNTGHLVSATSIFETIIRGKDLIENQTIAPQTTELQRVK